MLNLFYCLKALFCPSNLRDHSTVLCREQEVSEIEPFFLLSTFQHSCTCWFVCFFWSNKKFSFFLSDSSSSAAWHAVPAFIFFLFLKSLRPTKNTASSCMFNVSFSILSFGSVPEPPHLLVLFYAVHQSCVFVCVCVREWVKPVWIHVQQCV